MKRLTVTLLVACFMWFVTANSALAQLPTPMKNTYIHDFANVLSSSVKEELNHYSEQLDKGTGAEIMIVTMDSIQGQDPKMYATQLIRAWGIGDAKKNNGVLLLATFGQGQGNNDVVIAVGQGLEGALPDGKLGRILDDAFYPSASTGEVDQAFQATYAELFQTVAKEYNWDGEMPTQAVEDESMPNWLFVLLVILVLVFIIFSNGGGGPRSRGRGGYPGGFGGGFGRGGSSGGGFGGFGGGSSAGGGASRKF
ncbi:MULTISPECIES: TPM domain-containing protein [unclassified Lysinibacillus]|uniref:TPM domain-containing protein n=1 Tax=unclassified Lysinibacillus TaxID=2636778 RepID=UPI001167EAB9|nr:TPM domain-containing protein [Lysinibacillus sp. CD3-6]QPQ34406.1 TPM domain-containing protein [Lysinibacillus sp. JNUCC-52]UED79634.1 TPM domain-containing protein [Lysinibacillus sp. CD3-6]